MQRLSLLILFSIFISLVSSELKIPLRGTSRDLSRQSLSVNKNDKAPEQGSVGSGQVDTSTEPAKPEGDSTPNSSDTSVPETNDNQENGSESSKPTDSSGDSIDDITEASKCGTSFVMWFAHGIAVTTVNCGEYSAIYMGEKGKDDPAPKYITGDVKDIQIDSDGTIKVNGVKLSTISTDSGEPGDNANNGVSKGRLLNETEIPMVKVYSFKIADKSIEVKLPKSDEATKRDRYSLSSDGSIFYTGKDNDSKYSLRENGDLVNSTGDVVLKGDSSSSAFKLIYSFPSLFIILTSLVLI